MRLAPRAQVLQLPLAGPLERGGLSFVLKRPPGRGGAEWLKSAVGRDFFLDFSAVRRWMGPHLSRMRCTAQCYLRICSIVRLHVRLADLV